MVERDEIDPNYYIQIPYQKNKPVFRFLIDEDLPPNWKLAVAAGGKSVQNLFDVIRLAIEKLESKISKMEQDLMRLEDEFKRLIRESNGTYLRELNTALQTVASLWIRVDSLESNVRELRTLVKNDTPWS